MARDPDLGEVLELIRPITRPATAPPAKPLAEPVRQAPTAARYPGWLSFLIVVGVSCALWASICWGISALRGLG